MERFSIEALEFEQKKQEVLLEAAAARKMEAGEVKEFLDGIEGEIQALKGALFEREIALKKTADKTGKEEIKSVIEELKEQIAALSEIDADDEFTVRAAG